MLESICPIRRLSSRRRNPFMNLDQLALTPLAGLAPEIRRTGVDTSDTINAILNGL